MCWSHKLFGAILHLSGFFRNYFSLLSTKVLIKNIHTVHKLSSINVSAVCEIRMRLQLYDTFACWSADKVCHKIVGYTMVKHDSSFYSIFIGNYSL